MIFELLDYNAYSPSKRKRHIYYTVRRVVMSSANAYFFISFS